MRSSTADSRGTGKRYSGGWCPAARIRPKSPEKPRTYVLWDVDTGREVARRELDVIDQLLLPGTADGKQWLTHESQPPVFFSKYRFVDLTTGTRTDIPGVADPKKSCTPPSFSTDGTRLAYSDYEEAGRSGHVYEKAGDGWKPLGKVPGENAKLSPDGKRMATVGWASPERRWLEVALFDVADGKRRWSAKVDSYGLAGFTPDGKYVLQNDNAGLRLLDAASGEQKVLVRHDDRERTETAYHDGYVLAVDRAKTPHEVVRWEAAAGKEVSRTPLTAEYPRSRNRTPSFGSPRFVVLRGSVTRPIPGRPGVTDSVLLADILDPARPDWRAGYEIPGANELVLSPDGRTLAVVGYAGVRFFTIPEVK